MNEIGSSRSASSVPMRAGPLHIFEPRYRELIAECLEAKQPFGLVYAKTTGFAGRERSQPSSRSLSGSTTGG